jgi:4,5-DOPA dioxygenase extradiol
MNIPTRMPVVFAGHGSPMNALERNRCTDAWARIGAALPRPRGIVAISAHWTTPGTRASAAAAPATLHDFSGFPPALFEFRYPAPGDPALAQRLQQLLAPQPVTLDRARGLDHGAWSVLAHLFPRADVPVVSLSMDSSAAPAAHLELGRRLTPLRREGVLVLASGNVVHNLAEIRWSADAPAHDWALRFNDTVRRTLLARDDAGIIAAMAADDDARRSVPTPEHYLPLLYALGAAEPDEALALPLDGIEYGSIGMLTLTIGAAPA